MTDITHNHLRDVDCHDACPAWTTIVHKGDNIRHLPSSPDFGPASFMEQQATDGESIVDARRGIYGDPTLTYIRVAQIISAIIDHEVTAAEAALIQVAVKLVRTAETPDYSDNSDDIIGYMKMFQEIIGDDMIHAKSIGEYLALKQERDS